MRKILTKKLSERTLFIISISMLLVIAFFTESVIFADDDYLFRAPIELDTRWRGQTIQEKVMARIFPANLYQDRALVGGQDYSLLMPNRQFDRNGVFNELPGGIHFHGSNFYKDALNRPYGFDMANGRIRAATSKLPFIVLAGHGRSSSPSIAGLGTPAEVAPILGQLMSELELRSGIHRANQHVFVDSCYGPQYGVQLTREINNFDPVSGMTMGIDGPDGKVSKLIYVASHQDAMYSGYYRRSGMRPSSAIPEWADSLPANRNAWLATVPQQPDDSSPDILFPKSFSPAPSIARSAFISGGIGITSTAANTAISMWAINNPENPGAKAVLDSYADQAEFRNAIMTGVKSNGDPLTFWESVVYSMTVSHDSGMFMGSW